METNLGLGLSMLLVGMTTVFFILLFVVAGGNFLVRFTNKYYVPAVGAVSIKTEQSADSRKIAAIVAAVDIATKGEGKVASIKKSDN